jgi:ankyrin repeat protein
MKYHPEEYQESFKNLVEVCYAIDSRNIILLKKLLSNDRYIQCLDWSEDKWSIMCCEAELFNYFFKLDKIDVDNYVDFLENPLERAVKTQNIDLIRVIIDAGENLPNWSICLAAGLIAAIEISNMEIILLLLSRGANPSQSFSEEVPLISAVGRNNIALVELLLSQGAFIDPKDCGSHYTPLIIASVHGYFKIVKILVNAGADVNYISTETGEGALINAAVYGHTEIYDYLLSLTSDPQQIESAKNMFGIYK